MTLSLSHHDYQLLQAAAARAAIQDLTFTNNDAFESGDLQRWLNTFTVEGMLSLDGQQPIVGHKALSQFFRERRHGGLQVTVNAIVRVDRVTAAQRCRVVSLAPGSPGGTVQSVIDYDDQLVYERGPLVLLVPHRQRAALSAKRSDRPLLEGELGHWPWATATGERATGDGPRHGHGPIAAECHRMGQTSRVGRLDGAKCVRAPAGSSPKTDRPRAEARAGLRGLSLWPGDSKGWALSRRP